MLGSEKMASLKLVRSRHGDGASQYFTFYTCTSPVSEASVSPPLSKSRVTCLHMQTKGDLSDIFLFYQAHCCGVLFIILGCIRIIWKLTPWFISVDNTCTLLIIGCIRTAWKLTPWFILVDSTCENLLFCCKLVYMKLLFIP